MKKYQLAFEAGTLNEFIIVSACNVVYQKSQHPTSSNSKCISHTIASMKYKRCVKLWGMVACTQIRSFVDGDG